MNQPTNNPTVKVIFRQFPDGDVIALFPALAGDMNPYRTCLSYMLIGQHSAASIDIVQDTTPADEQDYRKIRRELENIGYNLKVSTRFSPKDLAARIEQTER